MNKKIYWEEIKYYFSKSAEIIFSSIGFFLLIIYFIFEAALMVGGLRELTEIDILYGKFIFLLGAVSIFFSFFLKIFRRLNNSDKNDKIIFNREKTKSNNVLDYFLTFLKYGIFIFGVYMMFSSLIIMTFVETTIERELELKFDFLLSLVFLFMGFLTSIYQRFDKIEKRFEKYLGGL